MVFGAVQALRRVLRPFDEPFESLRMALRTTQAQYGAQGTSTLILRETLRFALREPQDGAQGDMWGLACEGVRSFRPKLLGSRLRGNDGEARAGRGGGIAAVSLWRTGVADRRVALSTPGLVNGGRAGLACDGAG